MGRTASPAPATSRQSTIDSGAATSQVKHRFSDIPRILHVAKSDLGTKHICPTTGKKFYDLNKSPVISPYTGEVVPIAPIPPPRTRADAAPPTPPRPPPPPRRSIARRLRRSHAGARRGRRIGTARGGRRRGKYRE